MDVRQPSPYLIPGNGSSDWRVPLFLALAAHLAALWIAFPARQVVVSREAAQRPTRIRFIPPASLLPPPPAPAPESRDTVPVPVLIPPAPPDLAPEPVVDPSEAHFAGLAADPDPAPMLLGRPQGPPPPPGPPEPIRIQEERLERTYFVRPDYPLTARRLEVEGRVEMEVLIDAQGSVAEVRVIRDPGLGMADSAVRAVRQWRYRPLRVAGRAVPAWIEVEVRFRLR